MRHDSVTRPKLTAANANDSKIADVGSGTVSIEVAPLALALTLMLMMALSKR